MQERERWGRGPRALKVSRSCFQLAAFIRDQVENSCCNKQLLQQTAVATCCHLTPYAFFFFSAHRPGPGAARTCRSGGYGDGVIRRCGQGTPELGFQTHSAVAQRAWVLDQSEKPSKVHRCACRRGRNLLKREEAQMSVINLETRGLDSEMVSEMVVAELV